MKIKCKVCGQMIAYINGDIKELKCGYCGAKRKLCYKNKPRGFKLTMRPIHN